MQQYDAILDGDKLTLIGGHPKTTQPTPVRVTLEFVDPDGEPNGSKLARMAREFVYRTGGITSIPDAVAWQRQIREDRPLPGSE